MTFLGGVLRAETNIVSSIRPVKGYIMSWVIVTFLLAMWVLGMLTSYSLGWFNHVFFLFALLIVVNRLFQGPAALMQRRGDGVLRRYKRP
ncbi:MAG: DUF5670 family protein [Planctomycetota bacterium]|jgi:hypothetical protein